MTSITKTTQIGVPVERQDSAHYHKTRLTKIDLNRGASAAHDTRKSRDDAALKKQKRVRFQTEKVHVVALIPRWRDLPDDQVAELWWTHDAMNELKRDWKFAVYKIEQGEAPEDGEARGLEQHTGNGAWVYFSAQTRARNAVLEGQEKQSSDEEIARAYSTETIKYAQMALERAQLDAKEAKANRLRKAEAVLLIKEASKVKTIHNKKVNKSKASRTNLQRIGAIEPRREKGRTTVKSIAQTSHRK